MKNLILLLILVSVTFASCNRKKQQNETQANSSVEVFSLLNNHLPKEINLNQDISSLSLQELRLLHAYPYALRGLNFDEADIFAFFSANSDWYKDLVYQLWEDDKLPLTFKDVPLSAEEQSFVDKIDLRITELRQVNFTNTNGSRIGNVNNIVNRFQFTDYDSLFLEKLRQNNFVITSGQNLQLFHLYEENDYRQIPSFITTDLYLQAFHTYFSYTLKSLEQEHFISILTELCEGLYDESMRLSQTETDAEIRNLAQYNAAFYAIPCYFLTGKELTVHESYKKDFADEISNITNEVDATSAFMSFEEVNFPYSLFKPRGHYTRKPELSAYFKAMMWLQTAVFCRNNKEQLRQSIFAAVLLNTSKSGKNTPLLDLYNAIYESIVFLVGLPDNLSIMDIAAYLKKQNITNPNEALRSENIEGVNRMLVELTRSRNQIKPKIEISCPDKINFMPQRYLIDNDIMMHLVDVGINSQKAYPKGLDVFAALGSSSAAGLLNKFHKENETWKEYPAEMGKLQKKFDKYNAWDSSIYNKWIESLLAMQQTDKNYPEFMQTEAWDIKNLNTSLASWAELKHDAILYGEQPMAAECGGGGPSAPIVRGYVEPNLRFWNKLSEMTVLTQQLLEKHRLFTPDLKGKTEQLADMASFLQQITRKELSKQRLTNSEYESIRIIGSSMEYFTLSILDPDLQLDSWSFVEGPDKSVAVVADIYTRNVPDCPKNGVLHAATGNVNDIYVVVEMEGFLYLTRGATFSYYEFVQPPGTRLTDEEWQKMLDEGKAPAPPQWMKNILIDEKPKADERVFYSSGC
jgi:hypothetical protein